MQIIISSTGLQTSENDVFRRLVMDELTKEHIKTKMRNLYFADDIRFCYDKKYEFIFAELCDNLHLISKGELTALCVSLGYNSGTIDIDVSTEIKQNESEYQQARFSAEDLKGTFLSIFLSQKEREIGKLNMSILNRKQDFIETVQNFFAAGMKILYNAVLEDYVHVRDSYNELCISECDEPLFLQQFMSFVLSHVS
jgi:hypothetical protein